MAADSGPTRIDKRTDARQTDRRAGAELSKHQNAPTNKRATGEKDDPDAPLGSPARILLCRRRPPQPAVSRQRSRRKRPSSASASFASWIGLRESHPPANISRLRHLLRMGAHFSRARSDASRQLRRRRRRAAKCFTQNTGRQLIKKHFMARQYRAHIKGLAHDSLEPSRAEPSRAESGCRETSGGGAEIPQVWRPQIARFSAPAATRKRRTVGACRTKLPSRDKRKEGGGMKVTTKLSSLRTSIGAR